MEENETSITQKKFLIHLRLLREHRTFYNILVSKNFDMMNQKLRECEGTYIEEKNGCLIGIK